MCHGSLYAWYTIPCLFCIAHSTGFSSAGCQIKKRRVPEVVSILIALLLANIIIFGIIFLLVTEVSSFLKDFPTLQKNFEVYLSKTNYWLINNFHVKRNFLNQQVQQISGNNNEIVANAFFSLTDIVNNLLLIPLYTFLILYYRKLLMKFLIDLCETEPAPRIFDVIEASNRLSAVIFLDY